MSWCNLSILPTKHLLSNNSDVLIWNVWVRIFIKSYHMPYRYSCERASGDRQLIQFPKRCVFWHDDVIRRKHFPSYWTFVRGIHRSPVDSPDKGQWHGAMMFSLICAWTNGSVNNRDDGDLRHHCTRYEVTVMESQKSRRHDAHVVVF